MRLRALALSLALLAAFPASQAAAKAKTHPPTYTKKVCATKSGSKLSVCLMAREHRMSKSPKSPIELQLTGTAKHLPKNLRIAFVGRRADGSNKLIVGCAFGVPACAIAILKFKPYKKIRARLQTKSQRVDLRSAWIKLPLKIT